MLYEEFFKWVLDVVFGHKEGEYGEYIGADGESSWRNIGGYQFHVYYSNGFDAASASIGKLCDPKDGDWCIDTFELWVGDDASVWGGEGFGEMYIPF